MDEIMTGLDFKINEVSARIKEMRQIEGMSVETMAKLTGVSREEYIDCEEGRHDLSFAFIYRTTSDQEPWEEEPTEGFEIKEQHHVVRISERSFILP